MKEKSFYKLCIVKKFAKKYICIGLRIYYTHTHTHNLTKEVYIDLLRIKKIMLFIYSCKIKLLSMLILSNIITLLNTATLSLILNKQH